MVSPVSANVDVPLIDKRSGQIISMSGQSLQIMDLETFEVFETDAADDEMKDKIRQGGEVEYWRVLERIKVVRAKG
jgi:translation initiation factor 5A